MFQEIISADIWKEAKPTIMEKKSLIEIPFPVFLEFFFFKPNHFTYDQKISSKSKPNSWGEGRKKITLFEGAAILIMKNLIEYAQNRFELIVPSTLLLIALFKFMSKYWIRDGCIMIEGNIKQSFAFLLKYSDGTRAGFLP